MMNSLLSATNPVFEAAWSVQICIICLNHYCTVYLMTNNIVIYIVTSYYNIDNCFSFRRYHPNPIARRTTITWPGCGWYKKYRPGTVHLVGIVPVLFPRNRVYR